MSIFSKMFNLLFLFNLFVLISVLYSGSEATDAQAIIDRAIEAHGGKHYLASRINFDFRDRHYVSERRGGVYHYQRIFSDSSGRVNDHLTNEGFFREVNDERIDLGEEWKSKYANSVNSVIYFALLPYALNDPAVQKRYLGEGTIGNEKYHEIEVTFRQEDGGKDYEDVFVYWIHQKKNTMDYLAYEFHTDGGGTRFRAAFNQRKVNNILFADYHNYKGPPPGVDLATFDTLFQAGNLKKASEIVLENVTVTLLKN